MRDAIRLAVIAGVLLLGLLGWALGAYIGASLGLSLGFVLLVIKWRGQPLWAWAFHYLRRNQLIELDEPVTVANDRSGGGVRYQDGVAVVAVQVLGKRHCPTLLIGSTTTETANTFDLCGLLALMRQSLGLTMESLSMVTAGSRRRATGDYPRIYDTFIGTSPYAGQRETWLVIRIRCLDNGDALRWRPTAGTAALAAAQRVAVALRGKGIRAKVATATDIVELERRLGKTALEPHNRRWNTVRGDGGWLTTYAYPPAAIRSDTLAHAWTLQADGIVQNVTLFPDGQACATVTVRTAQPPVASPSVALKTLPGEQAKAVAANMCSPRPDLRGVARGALPEALAVPAGPSGVLIGKVSVGDRLLLPLSDTGEISKVHIAADDAISKRMVVRTAGAGERVTVHTTDPQRWDSVRMPNVGLTDKPRPLPGTTVSVIDGSVPPAPRPNTVISVGPPETAGRVAADVLIAQTGPTTVQVTTDGHSYNVDVEFFRAENRYVASDSHIPFSSDMEMAD